jgi:hypothetical protein
MGVEESKETWTRVDLFRIPSALVVIKTEEDATRPEPATSTVMRVIGTFAWAKALRTGLISKGALHRSSAVDLAAMTDGHHQHNKPVVFDRGHDTIVAHPITPESLAVAG